VTTQRAGGDCVPSAFLIARAQSGDLRAMDELLRALQRPLYGHVLTILRDEEAAKDTLQDALLIVCRKLPWLRDPRWLRAWAYRIATREAVRRARRDRRWTEAARDEDLLRDLPEREGDEPIDDELAARLPSLLASVSPASRVVLRMHYLDGLSYGEIAEALEVSVGTVKSRLAYGLATLRRTLGAAAKR
jgi:RNA polymerase sigma-70 factor (ECF subfamily)